jgi:hypothetical protein
MSNAHKTLVETIAGARKFGDMNGMIILEYALKEHCVRVQSAS